MFYTDNGECQVVGQLMPNGNCGYFQCAYGSWTDDYANAPLIKKAMDCANGAGHADDFGAAGRPCTESRAECKKDEGKDITKLISWCNKKCPFKCSSYLAPNLLLD